MELITIMDTSIAPVDYRGTPVLSLRQVDELHQRPSGTARACFNRHKGEMVEGEDYITLSYEEWSKLPLKLDRIPNVRSKGGPRVSMTFLTETGYLLIVKPFSDKRSWQMQRVLIRSYFMVKDHLLSADACIPPRTIEVEEADWWKMRAELAELKLKVATGATEPRRRNASPEEEVRIIAWSRQGLGPTEMGRRLRRTADGIAAIVTRLKRDGRL